MLAILTVVFFGDSFFGGKALLMRDMFCDCFPWRQFTSQALRAGRLPLWNPYSLCGQPYLANPQTAVFYPPHLLYCILPVVFAMKAWIALHIFIAAAGMAALARHWRLEPAPALLAGISYAFSAHMISMLEFQSSVAVLVFGPLALLLADKLLQAAAPPGGALRRLAPLTALLALLYAALYLAGHQQTLINGLFIVGAWLAARGLARRNGAGLARGLAAFGIAGSLAIGLCLPQLLMTMELLPLSVRGVDLDPGLKITSYHPVWLLGWILPFLGGRPSHLGQWWGDARGIFEFWAGATYIGILPLILATASLAWLRRKGTTEAAEGAGGPSRRFLTLFCLGLAAFGLLMAMGKYTPLYMLFYNHAPFFKNLRWPSKFLQLVVFAAALLAGLGFQALIEAGREGGGRALRRAWPVAWAALFILMAVALPLAHGRPGFFTWLTAGAFVHKPEMPERLAGLVRDWDTALLFLGLSLAALLPFVLGRAWSRWRAAAQAAVVLLAFINLAVIGRQVHPLADDDVYRYRPDDALIQTSQAEPCRIGTDYMNNIQYWIYGVSNPAIYRFAALGLAGESALPSGVYRIQGGDVLQLAAYDKFKRLVDDPDDNRMMRAAALLNLRWFMKGPDLEEILGGRFPEQLGLTELRQSLPRALVLENWRTVPGEQEALNILMTSTHDIYRTVLLSETPQGFPAESMAAPLQPDVPITRPQQAGVESIRYDWNRVDLVAEAQRPAVLLLNDVHYPGWRAAVDGRPVPILRANLLFRAVMLQPGRHTVTFEYHPARFYAGLWGSFFSLLAIAALGLGDRLRRGIWS